MGTDTVESKPNGVPNNSEKKSIGLFKSTVSRMLVCVDESPMSGAIVPHARAIANGLGYRFQLLQVIEPDHVSHAPCDPVEWEIKRRETADYLDSLTKKYRIPSEEIDCLVLEGRAVDQINACIKDDQCAIAAFCRKDDSTIGHIGEAARRFMEASRGSVFMIPASAARQLVVRYSSILVPLDGSARAEAAIPVALSIAQSQNAKIILAHTITDPTVTQTQPNDSQMLELRARFIEQSRKLATAYLKRVQQRYTGAGIDIDSTLVTGPDSRREIISAIDTHSCDLIVLASHGASGHTDVPSGDVAGFIVARSPIPALMMREREFEPPQNAKQTSRVRLPTGAD